MNPTGGLLRPHRAGLIALFLSLATLATVAPPAIAQESADEYERVWFVPAFAGALSVDLTLSSSMMRRPTTTLTALTGSVGWRHFFDGHGTTILRIYGLYGQGGLLENGLYGRSRTIGGGAAITARALSEDFFFGTLSLFAEAAHLQLTPPDNRSFSSIAQRENGSRFSLGLETTFGSLFVLAPYLFGETGASIAISTFNLPSVSTFEFWGRWVIRFDWGIRSFTVNP